ncbi:MAG TPA: hypothetical protein VNE82_03780, partial [Candidatus Binataceae bacterium]|nr:hypothetical protein [Candidatus Binataceae bacterium]
MNPSLSTRDRWGLGAFAIYFVLTMLFFGRGVVGHFTRIHVGMNQPDPGQLMWCFTWLPHALEQGRNPVFSGAVWAPAGINAVWTTWMPLAGLIVWPITAAWGPVAAFNAVTLPLFALAGWSAFLLCRYVTGSWWSALASGYLFGFSGYMTFAAWYGDPHVLAVFPIPLGILAVLRVLNHELSRRRFIICFTALQVGLFGFFVE